MYVLFECLCVIEQVVSGTIYNLHSRDD